MMARSLLRVGVLILAAAAWGWVGVGVACLVLALHAATLTPILPVDRLEEQDAGVRQPLEGVNGR